MKKAMIFAAGLGTRLAPLTNDRPKALVELKGKPLLWHVAERLEAEGFYNLTVNVHHFAEQIKDYVSGGSFIEWAQDKGVILNISDESNQLLDTGGAVKKAAHTLFANDDDPVLIHNVDILSNAQLSNLYNTIGRNDALLLVSKRKTTRYLLFDKDMRLVGWQNIQTSELRTPYPELNTDNCTMLAFSGIHVISKQLANTMNSWPDKFSIIDFYIHRCRDLVIRGIVQPDLQLTDVGKIDTLKKLESEL